ncbi:MAG: V-type ATPase subunit [candidate division WOR-3 bacterium]
MFAEMINSNICYSEDSAYAFVSGRIRFRERFFFDKERYERLLQETTENGFLSSLSDTFYGQFRGGDVLQTLSAAEWENHFFLKEYIHSSDLLKILLFPFDLHNLKLFSKGLKLKKDLSLYSSPFGYFVYPNFPPEIAELAENPSFSDDQLEVTFFSQTYTIAQRFPFLVRYLSLLADVKNVLTLFRVIKFSLPSFQFLPYGHFSENFLSSLITLPIAEVPGKFPSPISEILKEIIPFIISGNFGFLRLEKRLNALVLSLLKKTRYATFGYEVLAAYYLSKRQEIENIRRIYLSRFVYQITDLAILRELVIL